MTSEALSVCSYWVLVCPLGLLSFVCKCSESLPSPATPQSQLDPHLKQNSRMLQWEHQCPRMMIVRKIDDYYFFLCVSTETCWTWTPFPNQTQVSSASSVNLILFMYLFIFYPIRVSNGPSIHPIIFNTHFFPEGYSGLQGFCCFPLHFCDIHLHWYVWKTTLWEHKNLLPIFSGFFEV